MRRIGDESQYDEKAIRHEKSLNGLTDAICFAFVMEDEAASEAFLAQYVLNNKDDNQMLEMNPTFTALLELKGREYLFFRDSAVQPKPTALDKGLSILTTPAKSSAGSLLADGGSNRKSFGTGDASLTATGNKKRQAVVFETMKLTLRRFLGDPSYKRVVLKIVDFNEVNL